MTEVLKNHWYLAVPSEQIKKNKMHPIEIMGEPVLFFRDSSLVVHAIKDLCPHRGIPLHFGRVVQDMVECPYHGWKFDGAGVCQEIPSLTSTQKLDCTKIKIKSYPVKEMYGAIWVFVGDSQFDQSLTPQPPNFPGIPLDAKPEICEVVEFPCHIDHAVIGLMDPAHGPYVHQSWFWRSSKSSYEKKKDFGPVTFGFRMKRHQPSKNSKAYKILGGEPTTEITFRIPGTRVEHVQVGEKSFYSLTALMPLANNRTQVVQMVFWNITWLKFVKPFIKSFGHTFLDQDLQAVTKQQQGLKYDPTLMLINDADTQAKWYFQLKKEWTEHLSANREFKNPVPETVLQWRS